MVWKTGVQSQVKSYQRLKKWYLMLPYLTLNIIRYDSRIKWSNPRKGVVPSPLVEVLGFSKNIFFRGWQEYLLYVSLVLLQLSGFHSIVLGT